MLVNQFDHACLSSVNGKGEQVRMRTVLDTACVIDVKGGGDKQVCDLFCGVVLERIRVHTISSRTDPEPAIKAVVDAAIKCFVSLRAVEQILPEETIPESHASLSALEGWHNLLQGQTRALRLDVEDRFGSIVGVTHQCVACETRHKAAEQISAQTELFDRDRKFEWSVIQQTIDAIW